jgi:hypothetical protein
MNDWQPIDTAPKDGTRMLLYPGDAFDVETGSFRDGCTTRPHNDDGYPLEPSHWMPLPKPPENQPLTTPPVDLGRIEQCVAFLDDQDPATQYAAVQGILDAAPALVAELRELRAIQERAKALARRWDEAAPTKAGGPQDLAFLMQAGSIVSALAGDHP